MNWNVKGTLTGILAIKPRRRIIRPLKRETPISIVSLDPANYVKIDVAAQAAASQAAQNRPKSLYAAIRKKLKN